MRIGDPMLAQHHRGAYFLAWDGPVAQFEIQIASVMYPMLRNLPLDFLSTCRAIA